MRRLLAVLLGTLMVPGALAVAPVAGAGLALGHYSAYVDGRYDFHTWLWSISSCNPPEPATGCAIVSANPMPIAKAYQWYSRAILNNGTYTLTVDVPDGLRCGDVYYGPTIPTHDVYTFDAVTLTGKLDSSFAAGCDNSSSRPGAPGGTFTYPFKLVRF